MLKMGTFAQHASQEPEMETEISVVFSTQINPRVVLCDWKISESLFTILLEKGRKIKTVHIEEASH